MDKTIKFKKNLILKRIVFTIMLLSIFYIIFNFSAQDGEKSGSISIKITENIVKVISKIKTINDTQRLYYIARLHPIVRKLAHFSLYTLVGFSVMGFFCTFDIKNKYKLLWSFLIGMVYASSDELHQLFIPGRSPQVMDVCIDSAGVLVGIFIMMLLIILFESIEEWLKK